MSAATSQTYVAPFDAIADQYDRIFTESRIGLAQRSSVWNEIEKVFKFGDRVLDLGCGTGVDACFLARRGVAVVACDSSPRMIEFANQRITNSGLQDLVFPRLLAAQDISSLAPAALFDGVFSNFGALNCVSDLRSLALSLAALVKPGAPAILCLMGQHCAWEILWYLAQGKPVKAFRRIRNAGIKGHLAGDTSVDLQYRSVRSLARTFSPEFRLKTVKGIGVSVPPSYLEPWISGHKSSFEFCVRADSFLGRCPGIRALADHILLQFERKNYD